MEGRIDPLYLQLFKTKKLRYKYESQILKSLVDIFSGGTPQKENTSYWNGDIFWASPKDFREFYLSRTEDTITKIGLANSSSKLAPVNSVLVVVRSGILQHTIPVAVNINPMAINQDVKVLIPSNNAILSRYLGYFITVMNDRILPLIVKHSTTVQSINSHEFGKLPIPLPPLNVQQQIIDIMDSAYEEKRTKEKQARELLDSINGYLLGELGISIPAEEENTSENRQFYVSSADVLGGRFDPRKYTKKYQQIFSAIQSSPFGKKSLREITVDDVSGNWGIDETESGEDLVSCLTIRATEFDNKYNLNLDNNRTKYRKYKSDVYEKIALSADDILIEKSGGSDDQPVGRVALVEKEMVKDNTLAYSNFIHKIIVDKISAHPQYVFEYLRLMHNIRATEVMQTQTNGIRNLIMGEYFRQTIILPDKNKQREFALEANRKRKQAKKLEDESDGIVKAAKAQVEKILLGG